MKQWLVFAMLSIFGQHAHACSCEASDETETQLVRRSFAEAATVAVMKVTTIDDDGEDGRPRAELALVYAFKDSASSPRSVHATGFYTATSLVQTSCDDTQLAVGDHVIAYVPHDGHVSFSMCSGANRLLDFGRLDLLYQLKQEHEAGTSTRVE